MPTQKDCCRCKKKTGVATNTRQHCGAEQPQTEKLQRKKVKFSEDWKERREKNSINKIEQWNKFAGKFFFLSNASKCLLFHVSSICSTPWFVFCFMHFILQLNHHKKSKLRKGPDHNLLRSQFKARINTGIKCICAKQATDS